MIKNQVTIPEKPAWIDDEWLRLAEENMKARGQWNWGPDDEQMFDWFGGDDGTLWVSECITEGPLVYKTALDSYNVRGIVMRPDLLHDEIYRESLRRASGLYCLLASCAMLRHDYPIQENPTSNMPDIGAKTFMRKALERLTQGVARSWFENHGWLLAYPKLVSSFAPQLYLFQHILEFGEIAITSQIQPKFGSVYLVRSFVDRAYWKIGRAKNTASRAKRFEVKLPIEIKLEHEIPCVNYIKAETHLHHVYVEKRVGGEWFTLDQTDVDEIKSIEWM